LLKKTRRDHRTHKAVANRIRIGLGLRHVEIGMQHDVPPEGLAVRTAQAMQLVGTAKTACIGGPNPKARTAQGLRGFKSARGGQFHRRLHICPAELVNV
jgi:hypothetical protein